MPKNFFDDNIFEMKASLNQENDDQDSKFRYVQLRMKVVKSRDTQNVNKFIKKTLIQIVDVSHKVLYT